MILPMVLLSNIDRGPVESLLVSKLPASDSLSNGFPDAPIAEPEHCSSERARAVSNRSAKVAWLPSSLADWADRVWRAVGMNELFRLSCSVYITLSRSAQLGLLRMVQGLGAEPGFVMSCRQAREPRITLRLFSAASTLEPLALTPGGRGTEAMYAPSLSSTLPA